MRIKAVMSDNGSAYTAHAYRRRSQSSDSGISESGPIDPHQRQAERLIQTLLNEWPTSGYGSQASEPQRYLY